MTDVMTPFNHNHEEALHDENENNFALHLKPVFDACDYNGDGFVKIHDLIELGKQHSVGNSGEELELILRQLDGSGNGRISFDEFCFKVQQIFQQANDVEPSPRDRVNSLEVKLPLKNKDPAAPVPEILEQIPEKPNDEARGRSFTDSEGFFEEIDTLSHSTASTYDFDEPRLSRRLSGNHHASRLVQSARTSLHGSMEEMKHVNGHRHSYSDGGGEGDFGLLSEEIKKLSSQLTIMKMDQDDHDDKQKRMREENRMLMNKINALEEQLHDQKNHSQVTVQEESQKYRKELQKVQRDHTENIDRLQIKLEEAEGHIENLKSVEPMLRKEIENSLEERRLAQQKIENLQAELIEKEKEIEHYKYKLKVKTDDLEREQHERVEEVMILTHEIENLKYMKNAAISQYDEHEDLLKQMEIIKKENNNLRTAQDDLRNQMFEQNTKIEMEKTHTLADELQTADKTDVLDALRAEENENHRLKQYVDQLLILIMQSDPMLLEK
ncbi:rab11 family-interacting protein 3-like isoform X2 [Clytia hemisphaerica]|uniref:Uncharacterized protein n=1 Tax=Clytia hemisphaerica TaxID=252671 RepID=A0A7M5UW95_9CNID